MTVFMVATYLVKPEKRQEFKPFWERFLRYMKDNPETFKEVKSLKLFTQMYGGSYGGYVEMWEFDKLTELAKHFEKWYADKGLMKVEEEWSRLTEQPATFSIWNAVV